MKKAFSLFFPVFLLLFLSACGSGTPQPVEEKKFVVAVTLNCEGPVYGFHYEYALDGIPCGGGDVRNKNGKPVKAGETFWIDLSQRGFPAEAALDGFSIQFFILLDDTHETPAGDPVAIHAAYGESYAIDIQGNASQAFHAVLPESTAS